MEIKIMLNDFVPIDCNASTKSANGLVEILFYKDLEGKLLIEEVTKQASLEEWQNAKFIY